MKPISTYILPQAVEIEEAVVGIILTSPSAMGKALPIITSEVFYKDENRNLFEICKSVFLKGMTIDIVSVHHYANEQGLQLNIGRLVELADKAPLPLNLEQYCLILKEKYLLRQTIEKCDTLMKDCLESETDALTVLNNSIVELIKLNNFNTQVQLNHISAYTNEILGLIDHLRSNPVECLGVDTGYRELNEAVSGFQRGDLIILAARPSMGKSAFMMNLVNNIALEQNRACAIFSLEMSGGQLDFRLKALRTNIACSRLMHGAVDDFEFEKVKDETARIANAPLYIDDSSVSDVVRLRAKIIEVSHRHKIEIIFIDYLQLLGGTDDRNRSRNEVIGEISRSLKQLAKDLDIPIVALSQLSRNLESRPQTEKRPKLSDLRESGEIEQNADVVMFLFRPEVYGITKYEDDKPTEGVCEVIVAKNRNGKLKTVYTQFLPSLMKFVEEETPEFIHEQPF